MMSLVLQKYSPIESLVKQAKRICFARLRCSAITASEGSSSGTESLKEETTETSSFKSLADYRFIYPEFLPDPRFEFRNKIREKLERIDMLKRRSIIDIPEFYVGSILSVTTSDPFAPGKQNRFVGICISRSFSGLRAAFVLRNIIDGQGIEISYEMYNPTVKIIEVLRLEKRLDNELYYLRDCDPEHSTFPLDMEPEYIMEGEPVRVNSIILKLKPRPWSRKWYLKGLKGAEYSEDQLFPMNIRVRAKLQAPWESYDIMKKYRKTIPEEDQQEIWEDLATHRKQFQLKKQQWKKRSLQKAPPKQQERDASS